MKRHLLLVIVFVIAKSVFAQVPANYEVSTMLNYEFEDEVSNLAIQRMFEIGSPDTNLIVVPQHQLDTIWKGLAAIYNAESFPPHDTIFNFCCFGNSTFNTNISYRIIFEIDVNSMLNEIWQNGNTITGLYPELDYLLNAYGFTFQNYFSFSTSNNAYVFFKTNLLINEFAFCNAVESLNLTGINGVGRNINMGDGSNIYYYRSNNSLYFDFDYGWGDCYSACINHYTWSYVVNLDESIVEYLGYESDIYPFASELPDTINCSFSENENIILADTTQACGDLTVNFSNQSAVDPMAIMWDFGDGVYSSEQNPTHTYTTSGFYDVTIEVINYNGDNDSLTLENFIRVYDYPDLSLEALYDDCNQDSLYAGCSFVEYIWDGVEGNAYHPITDVGTYQVVVTDGYGCTASDEITIDETPSDIHVNVVTEPASNADACDGYAEVIINGGEPPYEVIWITGSTGMYDNALIPGNYYVTVYDNAGYECELFFHIGIAEANNSIVVNVSDVGNEVVFGDGDVTVFLYQEVSDEIQYVGQQATNDDGAVVFDALNQGKYYVRAALNNPEVLQLFPHMFYQNQMSHETANAIIPINEQTYNCNIVFQQDYNSTGTVAIYGNVSINSNKNSTVYPNVPVLVKSINTGAFVDLTLTDSEGNYSFQNLLDNEDLLVFVSCFEYPEYICAEINTNETEAIEQNFVALNDSIIPVEYLSIQAVSNVMNIRVFPNPADNVINITGVRLETDVEIFDLYGRLCGCYRFNDDSTIDVSEFKSGLYFIKVNNCFGSKVLKITVTKN